MRSIFIPEEKLASLVSLIVRSLVLVVLALAGGTCGTKAAADQGGLEITAAQLQSGPQDLADVILIAEDPGRSWTLQDAADPARDGDFRPYAGSGLAGSQSASAFWVKLELAHAEAERRDLILELEKPHLSEVSFYWTDGPTGRLLEEVHAGRALPFKDRLVRHRNFIYPLSVAPDSRQVIYMRIVTDSYLQIPLKLWTADGFVGKEQSINLALGMFYGVILGIALFNLFLFLLIRERVYLYYVLFVTAFALLQSVWDGIAYQYLWPGWPGWEAKANPVLLVSSVLLALLFTHHFISTSEYAPRIGRWNRVAAGGLALLLIILLLLPPGGMATKAAVYGVAAGLAMIVINMAGVRLRSRASRYYASAWLLLLAGTLVNLLAAFKLLPLTALTLYAPRIGMGAEAVLLSMALADRYNSLKKAKQVEESQGLLLRELHGMTKTLTTTYDLDRLLDYTLRSFSMITGYEAGCILLRSEEGVAVKAEFGDSKQWMEAYPADQESIRGEEPDRSPERLVIPIRYQGCQLGKILLFSSRPVQVPDNELSILAEYAGQVGISIENARLFQETSRLAVTDGLTGAFNRSHVLQLAASEFWRCQEERKPMSLIMLDIDLFKEINDRYGHLAGDKVIRKLARTLTKLVHTNGVTGRYGGEEFIILLPGMSFEMACRLAERLREGISVLDIPLDSKETIRVTASLGIAAAESSMKSVDELINRADAALYRAKEAGRNRVETEGPAPHRQTGTVQ